MRLFLLTSLTMCAFAANSLLNRLAVGSGAADPASFAVIRVLSGAAMLAFLVILRGGAIPFLDRARVAGATALALYMVGFSLAYLTLDAGLGALILFGVVQITMFVLAAAWGNPASVRQIAGATVAFLGLAWVLWPSGSWSTDLTGAALMVAAGIGWAIYTLSGRGATDALAATAANFCLCLPLVAILLPVSPVPLAINPLGVALAVVSGAVTSGLGYALWYRLLPHLDTGVAAIVQLSVPVIALVGGVVLLGETATLRLLMGAVLVLGGIAMALRTPKRP